MESMKLAGMARLWALALALSALLVAAGQRWPAPLPLQPALVWGLVLVPPLVLGLWLLTHWSLADPDGGESKH
jgi:ABC-type molybdate transport system permease subunit